MSYRDAAPSTVTPCEPMDCEDCGRPLTAEDEGSRCWPCTCADVKRTNAQRLTISTPRRRP